MLALSLFLSVPALQAAPVDRKSEGDWYISDTTDNNTGEREVYAMQLYIKPDDPDFITLRLRCSNGKPTFVVDWSNLSFPDQTVLGIAPIANPNMQPGDNRYVFAKSQDIAEHGFFAAPDASAKIVASIGRAKNLTITAYLASGTRSVTMDVAGTPEAWNRVVRHCPVQILPRPPL